MKAFTLYQLRTISLCLLIAKILIANDLKKWHRIRTHFHTSILPYLKKCYAKKLSVARIQNTEKTKGIFPDKCFWPDRRNHLLPDDFPFHPARNELRQFSYKRQRHLPCGQAGRFERQRKRG